MTKTATRSPATVPVTSVPIGTVKPSSRNARRHPPAQIEALARSIQQHGWLAPLVVDSASNLVIGHGRLEAAKSLGFKHVPVVVLPDGYTDAQVNALRILDNRLGEMSSWDFDALMIEIEDLKLDEGVASSDLFGTVLEALPDVDAKPQRIEWVDATALKPHPNNYKIHPADQLEHLKQSVRDFGVFRPIFISSDGYVLVGHGVLAACMQLGIARIPTARMAFAHDSKEAHKLLIVDNELEHLAEVDDAQLVALLHDLLDDDLLLGTGFDEMMVANLAHLTKPPDRTARDAQAQYTRGLPEYTEGVDIYTLRVRFASPDDRMQFMRQSGMKLPSDATNKKIELSQWWPDAERCSRSDLRFEPVEETDPAERVDVDGYIPEVDGGGTEAN